MCWSTVYRSSKYAAIFVSVVLFYARCHFPRHTFARNDELHVSPCFSWTSWLCFSHTDWVWLLVPKCNGVFTFSNINLLISETWRSGSWETKGTVCYYIWTVHYGTNLSTPYHDELIAWSVFHLKSCDYTHALSGVSRGRCRLTFSLLWYWHTSLSLTPQGIVIYLV